MLHMRLFWEWCIFEVSMLDNCLCKCYTWDYLLNDIYLKFQCLIIVHINVTHEIILWMIYMWSFNVR
jgi:hypothetical protein